MPAAIGLQRAMFERGEVAGRELSICCANDEGLARYMCPSLTSTIKAAAEPYLRVCVDWMAGGDWVGPLLMRPVNLEVFIGETTGVPATAEPSTPVLLQNGDTKTVLTVGAPTPLTRSKTAKNGSAAARI